MKAPALVRWTVSTLSVVLIISSLVSCSGDDDPAAPPREDLRSKYGLTTISYDDLPYPPGNQPTDPGYAERVELGRLLFFDHILAGRHDTSCGTCHHPAFAWADARDLGAGVSGEGIGPDRIIMDPMINPMPRNVPTNLNAGLSSQVDGGAPSWNGVLFWDGRAHRLEVQALQPAATFDEMRHYAYTDSAAADSVVMRLRSLSGYLEPFREAFPTEAAEMEVHPDDPTRHVIRRGTAERALAAYQRELVTLTSPYDHYVRGDDYALTDAQFRGLDLFFGKANCGSCHYGPMLSSYEFTRVGVENHGPGRPPISHGGDGTDRGLYEHTSVADDLYRFRTPTLRNVELTGPYFRNGVASTLREVVEFFDQGGNTAGLNPSKIDPRVYPLQLTEQEIDDLVEFMKALTDRTIDSPFVDPTVPESVPSGLAPVERIEPFSLVPVNP
jgi:cytochrome c peroxidase